MSDASSIITRLAAGADDAPAILAPERDALTHGALRRQMQAAAEQLNARGIGRGDRVAIVLPNGPEMATAFLSVAACATTAPLNPAYRADELDFYLTDIGAKAILVAEDETGPAVTVAERLGIGVLRLVALKDAPAGSFRIEGDAIGPQAPAELAQARRHRAAAAYVGHHVAPETGSAQPRQSRGVRRAYRRDAELWRPTTAASTSCRCSTSMG